MKRTERRHLKENEIEMFTRQAREAFEKRRREVTAGVAIAVVAAAVAIGYLVWRDGVQRRAHALLADAMAVQQVRVGPPAAERAPTGPSFASERDRAQAALAKFKAAADAYPSTADGIYARYQEAAIYMLLGQPQQAAATYQQVIDRAGSGIYGQMARLGLAEAQARAGQYDAAIKTFTDLSHKQDGPLPTDAILMQLGRTYLEAGKRTEAQQTFNRVVEEFPESAFSGDARRELDNLKKT